MSKYKHWRLTAIVGNFDNVPIIASEIRFVNKEGIDSNDPNKMSQSSSSDSHTSSNLVDGSTHTYSQSGVFPDNNRLGYWIRYDFDVPVEVTHISARMKVPSEGTSWNSCNVEVSEDGEVWNYMGFCVFSFPPNTSEVKTIEIVKSSKGVLGDSWWNLIPGVNCILAIDPSSKLGNNGRELAAANNKNLILKAHTSQAPLTYTETSGFLSDYYTVDLNKFLKYRAISLKRNRLKLDRGIKLPGEHTVVALINVGSGAILMGQTGGRSFLLAFGAYARNTPTYMWYNFTFSYGAHFTTHVHPEQLRRQHGANIERVAMRGNSVTNDYDLVTTYGTYSLRQAFYGTVQELQEQTYDVIGSQNDLENTSDIDIIAFGIFDKSLSDENLKAIYDKIDEQFLLKTSNVDFTPVGIGRAFYEESYTQMENIKPSFRGINQPTGITFAVGENETYSKDIFINEYGDIEDFVYEENIPVVTTLFLIDRSTGMLMGVTQSKEDGSFSFKNVDKSKNYVIISSDRKYQFNSIIKDYLLKGA